MSSLVSSTSLVRDNATRHTTLIHEWKFQFHATTHVRTGEADRGSGGRAPGHGHAALGRWAGATGLEEADRRRAQERRVRMARAGAPMTALEAALMPIIRQ